ncbi:protein kinase domain containing protein, partial [Entamoeba invadens IP1]
MLLLFFFTFSFSQKCSSGCIGGCLSDYTCLGQCKNTYENDTSCLLCKDIYHTAAAVSSVYLPHNNSCEQKTQIINKKKWLPPQSYMTEIYVDIPTVFKIDENSDIDYSFCYYNPKYRIGKWIKLNMTLVKAPFIAFNFSKTAPVDVTVDLTLNQEEFSVGACTAHFLMSKNVTQRFFKGPNVPPTNPITGERYTEFMYYLFISTNEIADFEFSVHVVESVDKIWDVSFDIPPTEIDEIARSGEKRDVYIEFETYGTFHFPSCMPSMLFKMAIFTIEFSGNYSVRLSTKKLNKMNYLQEFAVEQDIDNHVTTSCVNVWNGALHGNQDQISNVGVEIKLSSTLKNTNKLEFNYSDPQNSNFVKKSLISSKYSDIKMVKVNNKYVTKSAQEVILKNEGVDGPSKKRYFAIMSQDYFNAITLEYEVICKNDCNMYKRQGFCLTSYSKCQCVDGYGGDDCHLKCYHNNKWQVTDTTNLCYFGTTNCDQYCACATGTTLVGHICISNECRSGKIGSGEQCKQTTEGCNENCYCDTNSYVFKNNTCVPKTCGNNKIDKIYLNNQFIREEE